ERDEFALLGFERTIVDPLEFFRPVAVEVLPVRRVRLHALDEVAPQGQGGLAAHAFRHALEADPPVERTDPADGDQLWRHADEPAVGMELRRAGLARDRALDADLLVAQR